MADKETEQRATRWNTALSNLTTVASPNHPVGTPKPPNETDRVGQIILSNLAVRNDPA